MKKNVKSLFILQVVLGVLALGSLIGSIAFGSIQDQSFPFVGAGGTVPTTIDSGYEGGAIGLGIICAACLVCITWLQIVRTNLNGD